MKRITNREMVLITLSIFLAFSPIMVTTNLKLSRGNSDDIECDYDNVNLSAVSEKIHITNNSGWVAFRSAGNCTGNGTYSDPYVIEDMVIDANDMGSCILIENSDVYFRIENCTLYNARGSSGGYSNAGIRLSFVNNSQLFDNNCTSNSKGIYLINSNNNTISVNTANNNVDFGVSLYSSNYNNISGNTANNNYWAGIFILYSENNTVSGNIANDNYYYGIFLSHSNYNTVSGNTANDSYLSGIEIYYSDNNTISVNTQNNSRYGISLGYSHNNTISGNIANDNKLYGIYLSHSNYNTVSGNIMTGNSVCISESSCIGNIFMDNDCGKRDEKILGYNLFFLLGILSAGAIILIKKLKNNE